MNFVDGHGGFIFLYYIPLNNVFLVFSLFSILNYIKITVEHSVFGLFGKVANNRHNDLKGDDKDDDNADFDDENSFIGWRICRKNSDEPAKRVLDFFEGEENNPAVDKDT